MEENFESSGFDAFLLDKNGNIIVSKLSEGEGEIGESAISLLENCSCISGCFKQGEVEDFILHGKGGYIIAVKLHSMILAVSGVKEPEIGETLVRVKTVAKLIEEKELVK